MHNISGTGTKVETPHTDPDYAPTVEVFDHLGYDEIYRGVMQLQPEVLTAGKHAWQTSASGMAQAVQEANAEVRAAMADGWRGSAAQLASEAMQAFESLGQHLSDVMAEVGRRLGQANDAAESLRSSLSQPVSSSVDLEGALLDPKHALTTSEMQKTAENVRLDAVRVMNSVYAGVFIPTGNNVPGFPVGGMYPHAPVTAPGSTVVAPGGGSADVVTPGLIPASGAHITAAQPDSAHRTDHPAAAQQPATDRTAAPAAVNPAGVAAPAAPSPPVAATHTSAVQAAPGEPNASAPQVDRSAPAAPSATAAGAMVSPGAVKPSNAPTKPQSASTKPQGTTSQSSDGDRKDKNQQGDQSSSGDTASGMGAGIVGGLAGGAVAFGGDTTRPANSVPRPPKQSPDDEDYDEDEYYPDFDEPTFLEPAEPGTELVGHLEPTTPPVVGEWADDEE
ncbi:uncharacterized protein YukE [Nocardia sp. GAS34]|uniref:WXG100 family type VII secretion target n=1 Tax=unclassified Nocardia TaxID=2637762 RepID=UPI003D1E7D34